MYMLIVRNILEKKLLANDFGIKDDNNSKFDVLDKYLWSSS